MFSPLLALGWTVDTCAFVRSEGFWISSAVSYVNVDLASEVASPGKPDMVCSVSESPQEYRNLDCSVK